jgi:hypothetical protein
MRVFGGLLVLLGVTTAFGQVITYTTDPTNFHTGNGVTGTCPTGAGGAGCPFFYQGQELQAVNNHFDLYFNSDGKDKLVGDEVVLIIGVPNDSAASNLLKSAAISSVTEFDPLGAASGTSEKVDFGLTPQLYGGGHGGSSAGFQGLMSSSDVYSFLGGDFAMINNSDSFVNWSAADATMSPTIVAANFGIYVWSIHTSTFQGTSALDIVGDGSIPLGSFILGYGENQTTTSCKVKGVTTTCTNITPFGNPFTQTGIVTSTGGGGGGGGGGNVPEPSSIILLGSGLLFACAKLRKKLARS